MRTLPNAGRRLRTLVLLMAGSATIGARPATAATEVFEYTGVTQQWVVPAGVTSATFHVFGASGGPNSASSIGGNGGEAEATIAVTPGETVYINVGRAGLIPVGPSGGLGGDSPGGGYGGAGGDSLGPMSHGGGNGGGSSDVRQGGTELANRVLVGAGGGGAGGTSCDNCGGFATGGDGGTTGTQGAAGLNDPDNTNPGVGWEGGCGGGGATSGGGGAAGEFVTNVCGLQGVFGLPGQLGHGGNGGDIGGPAGGGGGGGGGYYGGGGGGSGGSDQGVASGGGGGGGGSNFGPPGAVLKSGVNLGNGSVTITYEGGTGATATPTPALTPIAKSNCDAGKTKCVSAKQACLLKVHGTAQKQGLSPDSAELQKCRDTFDGGAKGAAAGCIGKLESKQDPKKPKTICSVTGDLVTLEGQVDAFVTTVVGAIAPGLPVASKCDAGKTTCVAKKASCLLKAHQAGAKNGAPADAAQLQKCRDKFDGGTKGAAAGCIGKLESKQDPQKPKTLCSATGNLVTLEGQVDAFVTDVVHEIQNVP